jgi:hypothetical protein
VFKPNRQSAIRTARLAIRRVAFIPLSPRSHSSSLE